MMEVKEQKTLRDDVLADNVKFIAVASVECRKANKEIDKLKAIYKLWRDLRVFPVVYDNDFTMLSDLIGCKMASGLCSFAARFSYKSGSSKYDQLSAHFHDRLLKEYLGSDTFPFGRDDYYNRLKDDTQHLNPERIKWVNRVLSGEFDDFVVEQS